MGETVLRGWAHGGHVHDFVTADHRHGWFDVRDGSWGFPEKQEHYSPMCVWLFGDGSDAPRDRAEFGRVCADGVWRVV